MAQVQHLFWKPDYFQAKGLRHTEIHFAAFVVRRNRSLGGAVRTLLNAPLNIALCASSRFKKKINRFFNLFIVNLSVKIFIYNAWLFARMQYWKANRHTNLRNSYLISCPEYPEALIRPGFSPKRT